MTQQMAEDTINIENALVSDSELNVEDLLNDEYKAILLERAKPFIELMTNNECALYEIETKLKVLDKEFSSLYHHNPIHAISTRVKAPMSILDKLRRKGLPVSVESIENHLNDVAGIRVVCSFQEDIYALAEMLCKQDDIVLIETKDYIKNPKPNGYRSLHLIVEVPIFLSHQKKPMRVEVQFRTIAMDFWASLEHEMKYKKQIENAGQIATELKQCADLISVVDGRMQEIRHMITKENGDAEENIIEVNGFRAV